MGRARGQSFESGSDEKIKDDVIERECLKCAYVV